MNYLTLLKLAGPETIIVVTALVVLGADLFALRDLELKFRFLIAGLICCVGCVVSLGWLVAFPQHADPFNGMLVVDHLTQTVKMALLVLTIVTVLLSIDSTFTTHVGEYLALILMAVVGMMFLVSSENILMIFISLELTSLSLYILTAFNKRNVKSAEAALKYFLFGGMAAAFTLFGLSLVYGISGSTNLAEIAKGVAQNAFYPKPGISTRTMDPLLIVAIVMTVIGFGFKIAAVPFHLWAPDTYEGAPTPSAALVASGSKVASFFILAKVMVIGFHGAEGSGDWQAYLPGWVPVLAALAAASMVLGNLAAIVQSSVRRLLAYSAIAHAGYMLLGVMSQGAHNLSSLIYYAVTYGLTTVGAFGVVAIVQDRSGADKLSTFAGLSRREPVLAFCMMIFMLSLAGIPPLAGFFGKFYIFASALGGPKQLGMLWLVILAIAMSAVSLYYYLQVLKQIYIVQPESAALTATRAPILTQVVLALVALAVLVLGCAPNLLISKLVIAVQPALH